MKDRLCTVPHYVRVGTSELKTGYHFESPGIQTFSADDQVFCKASLHFIFTFFSDASATQHYYIQQRVNMRYRNTGKQTSITRLKAIQYRTERLIVISNNLTNLDRQRQNVIRGTQSISQKVVMRRGWEAKPGMLCEWVACKTV